MTKKKIFMRKWGNPFFIMSVDSSITGATSSASNQFLIPTTGTGYDYDIKTSDGQEITGITGSTTITFSGEGIFDVSIIGDFPRIYFNNTGDRSKVLEVKNWGNVQFSSFVNAFFGCNNMNITATDAPNLISPQSFSEAFRACSVLNCNIDHWDTTNITSLYRTFYGCSIFNSPLNSWNTSNLTSIYSTFYTCTNFNQDLDNWDTSNVTDAFYSTFTSCSNFNGNVSTWDVSGVANFYFMFGFCSNFNQSLNDWNMSGATNLNSMFYGATIFNQDLNNWDVSNVQSLTNAFRSCSNFNGNITGWTTTSLASMTFTFDACLVFNQNLDSWDVSNVTSFQSTFQNCRQLNQPFTNWDTSSANNMTSMFTNCWLFNEDVTNFVTSGVTSFNSMFSNCFVFDQDITGWDVSAGQSFSSMFNSAYVFNQNIGLWNVTSSATTLASMFTKARLFNQDLDGWDVSNVTTMASMFENAQVFNGNITTWDVGKVQTFTSFLNVWEIPAGGAFNQDLGGWNLSSAENLGGMFAYQKTFNQNLSGWTTSGVTSMQNMFAGCDAYNYSVDAWDVSNVSSFYAMFDGCDVFNQDFTSWTTPSATTIALMFRNCTNFNGDVTNFNVSGVTDFRSVFYLCYAFDQDISNWEPLSLSATGTTRTQSFFTGGGLSLDNYDSLLIKWDALTLYSGVTWTMGNSNYTLSGAGETARTNLLNKGITMLDGGGVSGFTLSTLTYDGVSKSVSSEDTNPLGVHFKSDGTKMYVVGADTDNVRQYTLSTPWVVSAATYDGISKSVSAQNLFPTDLFFSSDGTKMYISGSFLSNNVYQYTLSTPWVVSAATYDSIALNVGAQEGGITGLYFNPEGLKLYIIGSSSDSVHQYTLSTPWQISGATYDSISKNVNAQDATPRALYFNRIGTRMYVLGDSSKTVSEFRLSTAWDVSTATYVGVNYDFSSEDTLPNGIYLDPSEVKVYIVGSNTDAVYQYST